MRELKPGPERSRERMSVEGWPKRISSWNWQTRICSFVFLGAA